MGIEKLISKSVTFNSPRNTGSRMINTKYYTNSLLNPRIETHLILNKNSNKIEFSSKKFDNGDKFELYKLPDRMIKIVKNQFGEIKAFKSSISQHNENPMRTSENAKSIIASQTRNFLG